MRMRPTGGVGNAVSSAPARRSAGVRVSRIWIDSIDSIDSIVSAPSSRYGEAVRLETPLGSLSLCVAVTCTSWRENTAWSVSLYHSQSGRPEWSSTLAQLDSILKNMKAGIAIAILNVHTWAGLGRAC